VGLIFLLSEKFNSQFNQKVVARPKLSYKDQRKAQVLGVLLDRRSAWFALAAVYGSVLFHEPGQKARGL